MPLSVTRGGVYARTHPNARRRARAQGGEGGTHYAHMTASNQKTKTITPSTVSHLAFDLGTSIGAFSPQNRARFIYRWRRRVALRAQAEAAGISFQLQTG